MVKNTANGFLVNVQDVQEFSCQQLNRDVWSNESSSKHYQGEFLFSGRWGLPFGSIFLVEGVHI